MTLYDEFLNEKQKQRLAVLDQRREHLVLRSKEYAREKAAIIHAATERRRRAEVRQKKA